MNKRRNSRNSQTYRFGKGTIFIGVTPERVPAVQSAYDELLNAGMIDANQYASWTRVLHERGLQSLGTSPGFSFVVESEHAGKVTT